MDTEYREAVTYLAAVIAKFGGKYEDWYVGIARHSKSRPDEHNVQIEPWATYETTDDKTALAVESFFLYRPAPHTGRKK